MTSSEFHAEVAKDIIERAKWRFDDNMDAGIELIITMIQANILATPLCMNYLRKRTMTKKLNTLSKEFVFCTAHTCDHGWEYECYSDCPPHMQGSMPLAKMRRLREDSQKRYTPMLEG